METGNLTRQEARDGAVGALVWAPNPDGRVQLWERPLVGCRYLLSVRPGGAFKVVAGKRDRERSVIMVLRKGYIEEGSELWVPTRLVARLRPPSLLDPTPLAEMVVNMADWYGDALCFVEVKDGPIVAKECQRLGAAVQVREVLDKATDEWSKELGWLTDKETGPAALNALVNAVRETAEMAKGGTSNTEHCPRGTAGVSQSLGSTPNIQRGGLRMECAHAQAELATFPGDEATTALVSHDDDVRALATALYNIDSATLMHADQRARRPPADGWQVVETFGI